MFESLQETKEKVKNEKIQKKSYFYTKNLGTFSHRCVLIFRFTFFLSFLPPNNYQGINSIKTRDIELATCTSLVVKLSKLACLPFV